MCALQLARAIVLAAPLAGCAVATNPQAMEAQAIGTRAGPDATAFFTHASGLKIADTRLGTGAFPRSGQICVMHYTGWLYRDGTKQAKFDSSVDRGQPFEFPLGQGRVIRGWDEGVATMRVGGKRTLIIPPDLGYGAGGTNGIPPYSTLIFEVELLAVKG